MSTKRHEASSTIMVRFDVARASCACLHGRDAHATLKLLHYLLNNKLDSLIRSLPLAVLFPTSDKVISTQWQTPSLTS